MSTELRNRITSNPRLCGWRPCIRGMRIRVNDVLDMLAGGASEPRWSSVVQLLIDGNRLIEVR